MTSLKVYKTNQGNGVLVSLVTLVILTGLTLTFLKSSNLSLSLENLRYDKVSAQYQMETAMNIEEARLKRAISNIKLNGKLQYAGGPATENFTELSNLYVDPTNDVENGKILSKNFLVNAIESESFTSGGQPIAEHEFTDFATAFPSDWIDPNESDDSFYQVKYTFKPLPTRLQVSPAEIEFEYEYLVEVRAYGSVNYTEMQSELSGVIKVPLQNAPFSKWAIILNELKNQNGSTLVFAGGDTSEQFQEVYNGPVHVNGPGYFYGHPIFNDEFTSAAAYSSWYNWSVSGYTCCAIFNAGYQAGIPAVTFPTDFFNTLRLAAGDTSATAATNTATVDSTELEGLLAEHALGTLVGSVTTGIYIPIDNQVSKNPDGGIYVEGDARVSLNVVQGLSDFSSDEWTNINVSHQSCKFQKIRIVSPTGAMTSRNIYIGDDPCEVTYVFDGDTLTNAPVVLASRLNGNVYVNGKIDVLGGESRTRPAIAQDFGFHITATKDVRIVNDLQYEDVEYHELNADGSSGAGVVATAWGEANSSGLDPTAEDLSPMISDESHTVLGVSSLYRNVLIHTNAPPNINLHLAVYAGNSNAFDAGTGLGCGIDTAAKRGCGYGYEAWNTALNMGSIKLLGSIAEFKDQTTGVLSNPPKGYEQLFSYDYRLRQNIQPPAFPISNDFDAFPRIVSFKAWRLQSAL